MRRLLILVRWVLVGYAIPLPALLALLGLNLGWAVAIDETALVPLTIDNAVSPASAKSFLTDLRVFNAEFYRKLYPQLNLADDLAAQREWTSWGAKACRRGLLLFNARECLKRNTDLS